MLLIVTLFVFVHPKIHVKVRHVMRKEFFIMWFLNLFLLLIKEFRVPPDIMCTTGNIVYRATVISVISFLFYTGQIYSPFKNKK